MVGSVTVAPGTPTVSWKVRHALGDTKRHDVTYKPVAATRFREYFPLNTPTEDLVRRVEAGITTVAVNTARPTRPRSSLCCRHSAYSAPWRTGYLQAYGALLGCGCGCMGDGA